jgi:hypothetical protein
MSSGNETTWTNEIALKTRLRVAPPGQPTFEWQGRLRFRDGHTPAVADRVWILFDADDHESLMVDFSVREGAWDGVVRAADVGADTQAESFLAGVQQAQQQAGGDRAQLAELLRQQLGDGATIIDASGGAAAPAPPDRLGQLEKLGDLRDRGILTADEFEAQKRQLLGEPPA